MLEARSSQILLNNLQVQFNLTIYYNKKKKLSGNTKIIITNLRKM